uniref:Secreted protein n=1 Tax=Tetraodon nigroviridis TaxID=99883 RepID=H3C0S5_TETNG
MATASSCLWLLTVAALASPLCSQNCYELSPGGKRDVDHLSNPVDTCLLTCLLSPRGHVSSAPLGCAGESASFPRIFGIRGILNSRAKRLRTSTK